jgi:ankyrin repeat protein
VDVSLSQDLYHTCLACSISAQSLHNLPSLCAAQDGWTALHIAALEGHSACVEVLVAAGANMEAVNTVRGSSWLILHWSSLIVVP